jgi:L-cysteine S-thiosulfotransferase
MKGRMAQSLLVAAASLVGAVLVAAQDIEPADRRSGFDFMGVDSQAMQRDDTANPGMLWVGEGEALWERPEGPAPGRACATCHGAAADSMRGVAARYPAPDPATGRPIDLSSRIDRCRQAHQGAGALAAEGPELLALTAFVAHQSRGLPVVAPDPRLGAAVESGRRLFEERRGQLDLSCAQCHEAHAGQRLAGSTIPQGHPTGYPLYRLEWQGLGSLQRRLRNCMAGVRSEPYPYGAPELVELELFLMSRAAGMPLETPAVRP